MQVFYFMDITIQKNIDFLILAWYHIKEKNNRLKNALEKADKYIDRIKRVLNRLNEKIPDFKNEFSFNGWLQ